MTTSLTDDRNWSPPEWWRTAGGKPIAVTTCQACRALVRDTPADRDGHVAWHQGRVVTERLRVTVRPVEDDAGAAAARAYRRGYRAGRRDAL